MTGILNALVATGGLRNKMVAGSFSTDSFGYDQGIAGTLTPNTDLAGRTIIAVFTPDGGTHLVYDLTSATNPGQNAFTKLILQGPSGHLVLSSAAATYSYSGTTAGWTWATGYVINTGDTILLQAI